MRTVNVKERFLREERGFSLPEMLVTTVIMVVVLLALFSIFDMSVKVFSFGSNKVEAAQSARLGMEKMEREIRAAYPVNDTNSYLFFSADGSPSDPPQTMPTATQITFGNELGTEGAGDDVIECPDPDTDPDNCEYITYKLSPPSNASPCTLSPSGCSTLLRVNEADSADPGDPVSENAVVPGGLTFEYFESDGTTTATSEGDIAKVRVSLEIRVNPGTKNSANQRLTTEIDLRNRQ